MKRRNHLPWLTINLNFCIVARLPLTRYIPSTSRPENKRACFIFAHKRTETVKEKKKNVGRKVVVNQHQISLPHREDKFL